MKNLGTPRWFDFVGVDVLHASRRFLKSPTSTIAALICLALGIGGSCSIFSIVYGVIIDPFVYKGTASIVVPTFSQPDSEGRRPVLAYRMDDFNNLPAGMHAFESAMLWEQDTVIPQGGPIRNANVLKASSNFFQFLGTVAMVGRTFVPADVPHADNPPLIAVIGYAFWKSQFNGEPNIIGQDLNFRNQVYKVIGVMPPRFTWFDSDIYIPIDTRAGDRRFGSVNFRLAKGVSMEQASAELQVLSERFAKRNPTDYPDLPFRMHAERFQTWLYAKLTGKLLILMAAVSVLLLIACANVCVLIMSHSNARTKEIGVRMALGAGRRRIVLQLVTETLLLTLAGCVLGVSVAKIAIPEILRVLPETAIPREAVVGLNIPVLVWAVAISVVTGGLIGLALSFSMTRRNISYSLQSVSRGGSASRSAANARTVLITAEIALTTILLVGSGVAVHSLMAVDDVRLGYDPQDVAVVTAVMNRGSHSWEQQKDYFARLDRALVDTPGVKAVAETLTAVPPRIDFGATVHVSGPEDKMNAAVGLVSSSYFHALKVALSQGRIFSASEVADSAPVAMVDEAFAHKLSERGERVIGSYINVPELNMTRPGIELPPGRTASFQIIGVVPNVVNAGLLQRSRPTIYVPYTCALVGAVRMLVRTSGSPQSYEGVIRRTLHAFADSDQPLADFDSLEHILNLDSLAYPRASAVLFSVFAIFALTIAAAGLYSVISFNVSQRVQEFGIRMALGARPEQVGRLVLRSSLTMVLVGIVVGVFGGLACESVLGYYEQGWHSLDPLTLAIVCALQLAVTVLATWPLALRATTISPNLVLRAE